MFALTIMLVRHAEKLGEAGSLVVRGWQRAEGDSDEPFAKSET